MAKTDTVEEHDSEKSETKLEDVDFVIVAQLDPARANDPNGIYLDDLQREAAEDQRARVEGREPDYENMSTTASDVVVPKAVAKSQWPGDYDIDDNDNIDVITLSVSVTELPEEETDPTTPELAAKNVKEGEPKAARTGAPSSEPKKAPASSSK